MSNVKGSIKSDIKVLDEIFDVSVDIPTAKPSFESPYKLQIYSKTTQASLPPSEDVPMLVRLEAHYDTDSKSNTPENVYLELGPPESILPNTESFAIKSLSIVFSSGVYAHQKPETGGAKGSKPDTPAPDNKKINKKVKKEGADTQGR